MLLTRYLEKYEYIRTLKLMYEAFRDGEAFFKSFYGALDGSNECTGLIRSHKILVTENDAGKIVSMAHIKPVTAVYDTYELKASYILCVATELSYRRKGLMDALLCRIEADLRHMGEPFCFLVPVDSAIYTKRGYTHAFRFHEDERGLLVADDELFECRAKLLKSFAFEPPLSLKAREEKL